MQAETTTSSSITIVVAYSWQPTNITHCEFFKGFTKLAKGIIGDNNTYVSSSQPEVYYFVEYFIWKLTGWTTIIISITIIILFFFLFFFFFFFFLALKNDFGSSKQSSLCTRQKNRKASCYLKLSFHSCGEILEKTLA